MEPYFFSRARATVEQLQRGLQRMEFLWPQRRCHYRNQGASDVESLCARQPVHMPSRQFQRQPPAGPSELRDPSAGNDLHVILAHPSPPASPSTYNFLPLIARSERADLDPRQPRGAVRRKVGGGSWHQEARRARGGVSQARPAVPGAVHKL